MSLGNYDSAIIECANDSNDLFPFSKRGDVLFYPSNSNQRLCVTAQRQDTPALCISTSNIGFGTIDPMYHLHLKKKKCFWEDSELRLHGSCINVENKQGNTNMGRMSPSDKFPMMGYYTLADTQNMIKSGEVTANNAYSVIENIPVHYLTKKNENNAQKMMGCLANDIKDVYKPCVYGFDSKQVGDISTKMIDYSKLVPALIQCVKDLKARVDTLEAK